MSAVRRPRLGRRRGSRRSSATAAAGSAQRSPRTRARCPRARGPPDARRSGSGEWAVQQGVRGQGASAGSWVNDRAGAAPATRSRRKDHAPSPVPSSAVLERLYPDRGGITPQELASGLRLSERAPTERPYVLLNMVSTLDGKATIDWRTKGLSDELDRELFHHLRTQADCVLVGAGTVRAERYGRITKTDELRDKRAAEGLERDALAVVVSASGQLPSDLPMLQEPEQHVVVATGSGTRIEGASSRVDYLDTGDDLPLLMARLREDYGVRSVLCEGGPTLNAHLLAADLVDELFLTLSPKLLGGQAAITIVAGRELVEPVDLELVWVVKGGDSMFTRWRVRH